MNIYFIKKKCSARSSSKSRTYQLIPTAARDYKTKYFVKKEKYLFVRIVSQELQVKSLEPPMWSKNILPIISYDTMHYIK